MLRKAIYCNLLKTLNNWVNKINKLIYSKNKYDQSVSVSIESTGTQVNLDNTFMCQK